MIEKCDVILVFVNDNEKKAVCDAFKEKSKRDPGVVDGEVLTYHDFGGIGGAKVLGLQIEMGSTTPAGAAGQGCVLLIDEIDKADADLPNGLLETLGNGAFTVPYLDEPIGLKENAPPPWW